MEKFKDLKLSEDLLKSLKEQNITVPSEIQEKAIPLILEGKDVLGSSATGSGKTLAFGAGIIQNCVHGKGLQGLILTPTRELCEQVSKSLKQFSKYYKLNITEVYGGVGIERQIVDIKKSDIVVGTPGRILDHLNRGTIDLSKVKFLVLDEADRMLDMGFIVDVEKIIHKCPPKNRQTLLFSATIDSDIERLSKKFMNHPVYVEVKNQVDPSKLKQIFYDVPSNMKFSLLVHLLKKEKQGSVMIFCNTRRSVDLLANNLKRHNIDSLAIHGGLVQNKRNKIMENFHSIKLQILICTDVAARGLDIKDVYHVYNYDIPPNKTEYIHRIGRTARAGRDGEAINIVSKMDYDNFRSVRMDGSLKMEQSELPEFEILSANFSRDRNDENGRFSGRPRSFSRDSRRQGSDRDNRRTTGRSSYSGNRDRGRSKSMDNNHRSTGNKSYDRRPRSRDNRGDDSRKSGGNRDNHRSNNRNSYSGRTDDRSSRFGRDSRSSRGRANERPHRKNRDRR